MVVTAFQVTLYGTFSRETHRRTLIHLSLGKFPIQDSFIFRLFDSFDAISTLGTTSLTIISGMKAVTAQSRNDSS